MQIIIKAPLVPGDAKKGFAAAVGKISLRPLFNSVGTKGLAAGPIPRWQLLRSDDPDASVNPWDICHQLASGGLADGRVPVAFAEPDLTQKWLTSEPRVKQQAFGAASDGPHAQDEHYPTESSNFWFRDAQHGAYDAAYGQVGDPGADRVRVAHLDTGYDARHATVPKHLDLKHQRNFVDAKRPNDASDDTTGPFTNMGHGTGTLSILAGAGIKGGTPFGVAPQVEVIPIRVANSVVLFQNSAIAQALDYVHSLCGNPATRVDVITMSMGGLPSAAWVDAVNALYDAGVFIVTAAGNNYANLPTHEIVYPARFNRVAAACGVMADGSAYADLSFRLMAGNYGPPAKMATALAAFTPNVPWARLGFPEIIDFDGAGTSAATPQVAAVAAMWIQKNRATLDRYQQPWMRIEAIRHALFSGATADASQLDKLGHGRINALSTLAIPAAAAAELSATPADKLSFPILTLLTGVGLTAIDPGTRSMLELEAAQAAQANGLAVPETLDARSVKRLADELLAIPSLSKTLRTALGDGSGQRSAPAGGPAGQARPDAVAALHLRMARAPVPPTPAERRLRIYAFDPASSADLKTAGINEASIGICWEDDLKPGPIGEYVEVIDYDPASGCCYAPVDLDHPHLLAQEGLPPSEGNPQFHQQMCYAVAMRTIGNFERALGRRALWSPRFLKDKDDNVIGAEYVQRLRIYPHAMREKNSYYSPTRKALLLGYFTARDGDAGTTLPGGTVFCAVSHDIIAHETSHALLDGLHRRYQEATNPDVLAFHEAFADLVALFQHFTIPEALFQQVQQTRGKLDAESLLGQLAVQFGEAAFGRFTALREAIGSRDKETGQWKANVLSRTDYDPQKEPHELGAVLVSALFAAYIQLYEARTADLLRLVTNGTGVLPLGEISHDLAVRLASEAGRLAKQILGMCIRALDYCPPVDLTFGEYLRALITADRDLVPDDPRKYRVAIVSAFRDRGIYPSDVRSLSVDSLVWEPPPLPLRDLDWILGKMDLGWDGFADRKVAFDKSQQNAIEFRTWLLAPARAAELEALGFQRNTGPATIAGYQGDLHAVEIHSVRPARRVGPDGQSRTALVVEITQSFHLSGPVRAVRRGGCTLLIDLETRRAQYFILKRLAVLVQAGERQYGRRANAARELLRGSDETVGAVCHVASLPLRSVRCVSLKRPLARQKRLPHGRLASRSVRRRLPACKATSAAGAFASIDTALAIAC